MQVLVEMIYFTENICWLVIADTVRRKCCTAYIQASRTHELHAKTPTRETVQTAGRPTPPVYSTVQVGIQTLQLDIKYCSGTVTMQVAARRGARARGMCVCVCVCVWNHTGNHKSTDNILYIVYRYTNTRRYAWQLNQNTRWQGFSMTTKTTAKKNRNSKRKKIMKNNKKERKQSKIPITNTPANMHLCPDCTAEPPLSTFLSQTPRLALQNRVRNNAELISFILRVHTRFLTIIKTFF